MPEKRRCSWAEHDLPEQRYHDREWGVPSHRDRHLFELLILEGAQAGLSWSTILRKRAAYRRAFDNFDIPKVARFDAAKVRRLLADAGIVRNRLKIKSAIANAKAALAIQREHGSLSRYLWSFVGGKPIEHSRKRGVPAPDRTADSDAMSKALKEAGFTFVGSTISYAFMQAVGMVNDHQIGCF
ncbi:MAG: DNA-3-methyladenine glycosylase I, partial [Candidatus Eremiobacteraeota bacterium]|nr:DNA-3-methyladenine glycosylase I [Candidatus Eremiobacteraeota bacterium]